MVDRVGSILTPALLITIIALVVRAYFILNGNAEIKPHQAQDSAFFNGIIEGYFTMDALSIFVFLCNCN